MRVLVTGATGDIGAAIVDVLAPKSELIYAHYYQNEHGKELLDDRYNHITWIQADLTTLAGADTLVAALPECPDIIVHGAGFAEPALLQDVTDEKLVAFMNVHLLNPIRITRTLLPTMIERKAGNVVAISSIWGSMGASMEIPYASAKSGLNGFVRSLAREVAPSGIRVNGVAPGAIATKMLTTYSEDEKAMLAAEIPAGRLGCAKEVADAVSFLVSEQATYINGHILSVDGGWSC
ncbi:elongation factor P 5-aminopentanone reductase [Shouchella lonarensis]|uniref:3-oxoacyl-[acyl-carrier protein] reductase n=1 Tax=Shouchella lonarensis TaxID=1464122 RepID=A0A1G6LK66_9BACI|nr:SDR family oxidoreductase [Shouchella lonarensis]SDC43613.1 3-oxoacyl-[acyl-carrier protein] reductase [Shouchella lonarensis]